MSICFKLLPQASLQPTPLTIFSTTFSTILNGQEAVALPGIQFMKVKEIAKIQAITAYPLFLHKLIMLNISVISTRDLL